MVGAHLITRAAHNGGQVEPVGGPFPGIVLVESFRTALEKPQRADTVSAGGVGQRDTNLGETLPQVTFFGWPSLPAGFEHLMGGEGPSGLHQTPGLDQCLRRRERFLGDRFDTGASIGQRPSKSVAWPSLTRAP